MTAKDISNLLRQLVAIDSINPDLVPGGAGEQALAHYVEGWCRQRGLEVHLEDAAPGRPYVITIARGTGGGRSLMLNAHLDTVGVAGMADPHQPRLDGDRLYGRGAYDMKGSLAACMVALERVRGLALRGDVLLTAVADEEFASIGTAAILRNGWRADGCIVTEPTEMELCIAHKGFVWMDITTTGIAAHGSRPDLGVDAIAKMGAVLVALDHLNQHLRTLPPHPLLDTGSLHASLIRGGQELSSYPASCTLQIERRTIPGETVADVTAQVQHILTTLAAADPTFKAQAQATLAREWFATDPNAPLVSIVTTAAERTLGTPPPLVGRPFWMDAALTSSAGIPTVVFGPTGAGAHAVSEWVDLRTVAQCADLYTDVARHFCA